MSDLKQSLDKLLNYIDKAKETHGTSEAIDPDEDYGTRIDRTLGSLQNQIKQHQAALEKVRFVC